jgi:hypothetical protein
MGQSKRYDSSKAATPRVAGSLRVPLARAIGWACPAPELSARAECPLDSGDAGDGLSSPAVWVRAPDGSWRGLAPLGPSLAERLIADERSSQRAVAAESAPLALRPPRAAVVSGAPQALWCPVNRDSCAAAGAVSRRSLARPHGPGADIAAARQRRADSGAARLAAGLPVGKRTRRGKRAGKKRVSAR